MPDRLRRHHRFTPTAFTLVEVLIVVAVIGLLIALLAPALGGARESGRTTVCAANLRQLLLANEAYANDARDRFCPGAPAFAANLTRWHGSRTSAAGAFTPEGGTLTPYLSDSTTAHSASVAVRACPAFTPVQLALAEARIGVERSAGGYGYNNTFIGTDRAAAPGTPGAPPIWVVVSDRVGADRARFAHPAGTVAFADAALADGNRAPGTGGLVEYSFIEPRFWPDADPPARPDPSVHFRHFRSRSATAERAVAGWLDGHISRERRTLSVRSAVYPADPGEFGIGWFGGVDDNSAFDYH